MTSSSATTSPGFTRHATISASTVPSPRSGSFRTCLLIDSLRCLHRSRGFHHRLECGGNALRTGKIFPLEGMRVRRIPTRDALNRGLEMPEALLLHGGDQL